MQRYSRIITFAITLALTGSFAWADEEDDGSILRKPIPEAAVPVDNVTPPQAPVVPSDDPATRVGTKAFDAASVDELFEAQKAENARRAAEMAPHMNSEHLPVFELAPVETDPYHIRNFEELVNKIDPQPRRRLARLAELDPKAAADLHVSMRSEERFFAGEHDMGGDSNAGRTADVDFRTLGESIGDALKRANQALRARKPTDDQAPVPTAPE